MPPGIGYAKKQPRKRMNLGRYTPPSAGEDRVKMPGLLESGLNEQPYQDMNPAKLSAEGDMEMNKRTKRQKFGAFG